MNTAFFSLSILAMFATPAWATGASGAASTEKSDWLSLDREIAEISNAALNQAPSGFSVGGYVRANLTFSDDIQVPPSNDDFFGFLWDNIRIYAGAQISPNWEVYIETEAGSGPINILDAFVRGEVTDDVQFTMGQFRAPMLWTGLLDPNRLLFIPYTTAGSIWQSRDLGAQFHGRINRFFWWIAAQNGFDNQAEEFRYTGRVAFHAIGDQYMQNRKVEGAFGASEDLQVVVGVGASVDDGLMGTSDGDSAAADLVATWNRFYFHTEYVSQPNDPTTLGFRADANTWDATISYMLVPAKWEAALRYDEINNSPADTDAFTLGINRYLHGHDVKLQLNITTASASGAAIDTDIISFGITGGV